MPTEASTLTPRQQEYITRLKASHAGFLESLKGLDEQTLCSLPVVGDWTIKDALAHILAWNDEFRRDIEAILQGRQPGYDCVIAGEDDFAAWNRQQIALRQAHTWQQLLREFERDLQAGEALIVSLSQSDFRKRGVTPWKHAAREKPDVLTHQDTDMVQTLVTFHWRHINQHARQIRAWRRKRGLR